MSKVLKLKCVKCGREFKETEVLYTCPDCGIEGILDVELDYDLIRKELNREYLKNNRNYSLWRYLPAIPVEDTKGIQPLQAGWTPLYNIGSLSKETGLGSFFLKDDSRNPTASLKDRASAVGVAKAIELGRTVMCAASTGNAASSLSGFAAAAGIKTYIFVPKTAPEAKITQLLIYGSNVFLVKGTYDEAVELCFKASDEFGWYNRSCAINPYLIEGKKTISYEICEQMNFQAPDIAVVAVGDGCTIGGVWKGFKECFELGLIDKLPKIVGVQAENSNPVTRAFKSNTYEFEYRLPDTLADSISVGIPRNGIKALNALHESGGCMVDVSDEEILAAMKLLAQKTGVFGEPAGVTSFAGIMKMKELGLIKGDERVVSIVSGSGLKDIRSAMKAAGKASCVEPDLVDLKRILNK
ncbi:MAG: threonine synthase [Gracilibacteraceae bacterium]|jgi:threonine synthase|nr:threonine synthase [Gracilibacteraceae bacterium]